MGSPKLIAVLCLAGPGLATAQEPTSSSRMPSTFRWGYQRLDLVRYNRVEGLSIGARAQIRPQTFLGPLTVSATARLGTADRRPNGRLDFTHETIERRITFSAFHELAAVEEHARHLRVGNSALAAMARDDGDYYRRSGARLEWTPPSFERRDIRARAFAEFHSPVTVETNLSVWRLARGGFTFRDNLVADEGWLYGGVLEVSPRWGSDPTHPQGGVDLSLESAAGDFEYARAALSARLALPLPVDFRIGLEVGAGTSWGDPPAQRVWYLGGPTTLRGFEPRSLSGQNFRRARAELARPFSFGGLSLFYDVGWAGARGGFDRDDVLYAAGVGVAVLDGLIRLDSAWGLRSPHRFRFDAYLDSVR